MNDRDIYYKYQALRKKLISEMNPEGFWTGELSTSALSTAVAIVALKTAADPDDSVYIKEGYNWLCNNINEDGGYGDTTDSASNVSTTLLCYAAIHYCQVDNNGMLFLEKMEAWLETLGIILGTDNITSSILKYYGRDYTFSIPIISMLIICGVLQPDSLRKIPVLPFEFTLFPASWYRFLNLRVVSYALPALIAVGIYQHLRCKNRFPGTGYIRSLFIKPAVKKLIRLVPESGGFLEAIPLTGFVAMCLIESEYKDNKIVEKGLEFLRVQRRNDGGWPIDTDLSTWVTTLSVKALGKDLKEALNEDQVRNIRNHLLSLQYKTMHPFNGAGPGGWGWTSFSGSVPDADDTPGAILALIEIYEGSDEEVQAIERGCEWLMDLQNNDGGFPTFCRGWGKLPFDKSSPDLTGHALLALLRSDEILHLKLSGKTIARIEKSTFRAIRFLQRNQMEDGSWIPLWFGNQYTDNKTNPVYGSAKVSVYLGDCLEFRRPDETRIQQISRMVDRARNFLVSQQNNDGSWGGLIGTPGSIEETSLAVSALGSSSPETSEKGISWLMEQNKLTAAPIGLYFALLWYDEKLYPLIYSTEALGRFLSQLNIPDPETS